MTDASKLRPATGAERAALVLLALGETHGAPIWAELNDTEIAEITRAMARLGSVDKTLVDAALNLFDTEIAALSGFAGSPTSTERIIEKVLPELRAKPHLARLRKPQGLDVWEKLAGLKETVLSDYLAGEHPQTAAIVLKRMPPQQAARILEALPRDFALDCLNRMLSLETVKPAFLEAIEETLGGVINAASNAGEQGDATGEVADILNLVDKRAMEELLGRWAADDEGTAGKIRAKMFTFEDFARLSPAAIQSLLRGVDRDLLGLALKAAPQPLRQFFFDQMSMRAARMLEDQMAGRGPVRLADAQRAQARMIAIARDLEAAGELSLAIAGEETEEMVE
ncbi:MAG: flagellar motor switch protein FliG [Proteobacteria bacterium]|nr:flagellar motor switch protein FliG [Pseudomonadota bacterium]